MNVSDIPLKELLPSDHLFVETTDGTCSRCREEIGPDEVPLCLWPRPPAGSPHKMGDLMYQFCMRCAFDPDSDRCGACGCTEHNPCEPPCAWQRPGLCTSCVEPSGLDEGPREP